MLMGVNAAFAAEQLSRHNLVKPMKLLMLFAVLAGLRSATSASIDIRGRGGLLYNHSYNDDCMTRISGSAPARVRKATAAGIALLLLLDDGYGTS